MSRKDMGNQGEEIARALLERNGLDHVQSNFRCDMGEIDLIMRDGDAWVFIEVKSRSNERFASVVEQITADQCQRIRRCAQLFLIQQNLNEHVTFMRFDIVAIVMDFEQAQWLQDAF
ncbi:YraN family protein [Pseudidiomarina gelatinasegens]|jgi:putative endonuclease|uniref:UPF0102 protein EGC76_06270 n=1 Tax=Pseudidiomarina gelatinasegens TaxID=2487740 RepID=A0A451GDZ2_9GAMM|nr:YraN family protein [Pseudidiomarina gelatinasegens]RWU11143.1 YraN family protein [Pseudidiomarina gelatinasegens]|tara:strand:+ start:2725 stop:3075 length:351 start_codon:yes stop_codon:yes gene_type:complete